MEWPNQICFSNKEIADIQATLQRREGVPMQVEKELSGFWFHSDNWESELRVTFLSTFRLTVSRVCFIYRRRGTMTEIGAPLEAFAARIRYRSWSSSAWKRRKW